MTRRAKPKEVVIRQARPGEGPALSALALRSKAYWGYDNAFMAACVAELTVSPDSIQHNPTYVVEDAGRVLGFYLLEPLGEGEVELGYLFVEPDVIGCGYGSQLMRHAKATAAALGYHGMLIQGDPHAESFYRAMGGELVGGKPSASIPGRELPLFRIALVDAT